MPNILYEKFGSVAQELAPRPRGRPPKPELTPLEAVLSDPLPEEINQLAADLVKAKAAVDEAKRAYYEEQKVSAVTVEAKIERAAKAADSARNNLNYSRDEFNAASKDAAEARDAYKAEQRKWNPRPEDLAETERVCVAAEKREAAFKRAFEFAQEQYAAAQKVEEDARRDPEAAAYNALMRASAQQDIAAQIGSVAPAPTKAEMEELRAAYEKAKLQKAAMLGPRLEAFKNEVLSRANVVAQIRQTLIDLLAPLEAKWRATADKQLATAVTLIAQTEQIGSLVSKNQDVYRPFRRDRISGDGEHVGRHEIDGGEAMREVYLALYNSWEKANPRV